MKKNGAKIFGLDLNYVLASASSVWPRLRPQATTNKLQRALNVAARVVSGTHKFDRGLSLLLHTELHWLDVPERVVYIQTRRHGVQLPARSSASVPRGVVPTSRRCRITATSSIRHPTAPSRIAPPAQLLWPDRLSVWLVRLSGIPCRTACGIRLLAGTVSDNP